MLRHKFPTAQLIFLSSYSVKCIADFNCVKVFPLAPAWAMESTAATLNGDTNIFSESPSVLART